MLKFRRQRNSVISLNRLSTLFSMSSVLLTECLLLFEPGPVGCIKQLQHRHKLQRNHFSHNKGISIHGLKLAAWKMTAIYNCQVNVDVHVNFPSWKTTCLLLGDRNMWEISDEQLYKQLTERSLIQKRKKNCAVVSLIIISSGFLLLRKAEGEERTDLADIISELVGKSVHEKILPGEMSPACEC